MPFRVNSFFFVIVFVIFSPILAFCQPAIQLNSAEIKQGIKKLDVLGSALYIAAHPDDENTRLLSYLAKERNLRTGYLSLTRGDGGQNLIGNEQSELLGLIRTQELLAARKIDGAEQFFTRAIDFGFSKSSEETFRIWDRERILEDAVWVIRKFRPDIIITRFPEDSRAGHGQHAASAIIAREAFIAAADPKRFPEQLKFFSPWQATRIMWNTSNFGGNNTTGENQMKLDIGAFNPLLGKSYGEIAGESRTNHKSQGFGSARQRGQSIEYFQHTAGELAKTDILDGIQTDWDRVNGGRKIAELIQEIDRQFKVDEPEKSLDLMVALYAQIGSIDNFYWKSQKQAELKQLILASAGLWFETYSSNPVFAIGEKIAVRTQVVQQRPAEIELISVNQQPVNKKLVKGILLSVTNEFEKHQYTQPYWLRAPGTAGMFALSDSEMIGKAENEAAILINYSFAIANTILSFEQPVVFKYTDDVRGEVYEPLVIAPPVTASFGENAYVFGENKSKTISITLNSFKDNARGYIQLSLPPGWEASPSSIPFNIPNKGTSLIIPFSLSSRNGAESGEISLEIEIDGKNYQQGFTVIDYDHIPKQTIFPRANAVLHNVDLRIHGKKLAYIPGAGDRIPESLKQIGYDVTILDESQLVSADLMAFDAIITGIRAYNVNKQLSLVQPRLLSYVEHGGVLLVQYNINSGLLLKDIGPFPLNLSRDRVTEEDSEVRILKPDHPVMNFPNKITASDFDGWIQERGLYFSSGSDPRYEKMLSMNDPGESEKDGSLLVANYGKGRFVYTSLSFFRELPGGVPGAYRLFVNLISKNNK